MTGTQTLLVIITIVAAVAAILGFVLPELKKRGVSLDKALEQTQKAIKTTQDTFAVLRPFLADGQSVDIVDKILNTAKAGTGKAEQLYKIGELPAEERNKEAKQYVYDALKLSGIKITPDVEKLVDGAVEASVNALGHSVQLQVGVLEGFEAEPGTPAAAETAE